jgi:nitrile hydratase
MRHIAPPPRRGRWFYDAAMDGVHDMGGMHGFGPVVAESNEPVFHEPWEGHAFALMLLTSIRGLRRGPFRPDIETMPAARYLEASYYERWLRATEVGLVRAGAVSSDDIEGRIAAPIAPEQRIDPDGAALAVKLLTRPNTKSPPATPARFGAGDRVTVKRMAPRGHTRCPRYVRGVGGTIVTVHGGWPLPDDGEGAEPSTLYTVAFDMTELWGADAEPGLLYVDLWESYLE